MHDLTVGELIDELAALHPDMTIRLASQPSWPFEWTVSGVHVQPTGNDLPGAEQVAYLVEGSQLGYLPGDVASEIGWAA
jgi:hypothetical protein